NWAGLYDCRTGSCSRLKAVDLPEELTGNGTFHATVTGKDGKLTLVLSNAGIGMAPREVFTHTIAGFNEDDAHFGFTAGTGGAVSRHIVDNVVLQIGTPPAPPVAGFTAALRSGEAPLSVAFTNTSTNATSYSWSIGDGSPASTETSPTHVYRDPGTYTVALTATGEGGSDTQTEPGYVTVTASVLAAFTGSPVIGVAPLIVRFTNQSTGATSYSWDFGDGGTSTATSPSHTYAAGGEYTVTLTARGAGGAQDTSTRTRYVQVDGPLTADFTAAPRQGPAPLRVQFVDASGGSTVQGWLWDFGDGTTSQEQNPQHTYARDGQYAVALQVFGFATSDSESKAGFIAVGPAVGRFVRGEANGDGGTDISDAIYILSYLFVGGVFPDCLDALDADDTGSIDLTDAVRLLGYLFQGGPAPRPPFPAPGADPTDDLLDCSRS
ncbi:MAG: PKD domain-containing protein, partial [Planctomycetes bacterium]|nr:PKD domain-containing protein [Planctomycetota bacterium]